MNDSFRRELKVEVYLMTENAKKYTSCRLLMNSTPIIFCSHEPKSTRNRANPELAKKKYEKNWLLVEGYSNRSIVPLERIVKLRTIGW